MIVTLSPDSLGNRDKTILVGLYLSKYDSLGLSALGFETFVEAFNVMGYGLGSKPASIKNYRDEFDSFFPNPRKGWHKRETRPHCLRILELYKDLDFESFTELIKSLVGYDENPWIGIQIAEKADEVESAFAKRLITGLAAEKYFEAVHSSLILFQGRVIENTTRLGCGYDYRLRTIRIVTSWQWRLRA